jgi:hypothetical protein
VGTHSARCNTSLTPSDSAIVTAPISAQGHNGTVLFDGDFVTLQRKGFLARMSVGKGEKHIPLRSINAVQIKPAGPMMNGFIEFSLGGGDERRSQFGRQTVDAVNNENAVMFTRKQQPAFEHLRGAVEQAIAAASRPQPVYAPPPGYPQQQAPNGLVGQLQQLGQLRNSGALSDQEFQSAKARLLSGG